MLSFIWLPGIITGFTLSITDNTNDVALNAADEEELDPNTFGVKAGSILHGLGFMQTILPRI